MLLGGTHHAFTNRGEGFCMFNDQAIGAKYLQYQEFGQEDIDRRFRCASREWNRRDL